MILYRDYKFSFSRLNIYGDNLHCMQTIADPNIMKANIVKLTLNFI